MSDFEFPYYTSVSPGDFPALANLFAASARRRITEVHLHHTFIPTHADFHAAAKRRNGDTQAAGLELCRGMWKFHVFDRDFADIAQHVSIDPCGAIWLNRNWNRSPASATGFNGDHGAGPFMIETIGNFDEGEEELEDVQLHAVLTVVASVQLACGLEADALRFHNEMTDTKSCPGTGVVKSDVLQKVAGMRGVQQDGGGVCRDVPSYLTQLFDAFMATDYGALKEGPLPYHTKRNEL